MKKINLIIAIIICSLSACKEEPMCTAEEFIGTIEGSWSGASCEQSLPAIMNLQLDETGKDDILVFDGDQQIFSIEFNGAGEDGCFFKLVISENTPPGNGKKNGDEIQLTIGIESGDVPCTFTGSYKF